MNTDPIHKINFELNLSGIVRLLFVISFFIVIISGFIWMYNSKEDENNENSDKSKTKSHKCLNIQKNISNTSQNLSDSGISFQMDKH